MIFGKPNHKNTSLDQKHPYTDLPFLAVSGFARSGTTVLRNCVANHPDLDCANRESNYIHNIAKTCQLHFDHPHQSKNLIVEESAFWELHRQLILNLIWPVDSLKRKQAPKAISTYCQLDSVSFRGLQQLFPESSVLYIIRNGIEVVSSFQSFEYFSNRSFEDCCKDWNAKFPLIEMGARHKQFALMRYEWLLQDNKDEFTKCLTEVMNVIDVEFHESCLKPLRKRFHPTRYSGEDSSDTKDLSKRKDRWKLWTEQQRATFKTVCGETMDQLGYDVPWN